MATIDEMAKTLHEGEQSDAAVLNFSKVFVKVNHCKLSLKVEHFGVTGKLLNCMKDCLDRKMQDVTEGKMSDLVHVIQFIIEFHH